MDMMWEEGGSIEELLFLSSRVCAEGDPVDHLSGFSPENRRKDKADRQKTQTVGGGREPEGSDVEDQRTQKQKTGGV
jgi:hypothetical protein